MEYVERLQASGRYTFTRLEVRKESKASAEALQKSLRRLAVKGRIAVPRRGFYVVVATEYRGVGAPPPPWYIDDLMRFLQCPYFVGLLSAAAVHGAGHQQPQEFQVVARPGVVALRPDRPARGRSRDTRWNVLVNEDVDVEP